MQPLDPIKQSSDSLLCGEILNDARREGERLIQQAREEAESFIRQTVAQEENTRKEQLETVRQNVTRHAEQILATVPIETERLRRVRLESELNTILDEVHRKLLAREGFDYAESLVSCATEAIRRMDGNEFVVKLSPEDHAAYAGTLTVEIQNRSGRPRVTLAFQDDPTITGGGLIVLSGDGHQQFDARFSAKLARLWPTLRRQLASSSPPSP
ncbi:MAG: V-type ATP synthase subunit E family protein, partial [bacterium]